MDAALRIGPSYLELEHARPQRALSTRQGTPTGKITEQRTVSKILRAERIWWIYTPAEFDAKRTIAYPVLICFDGPNYLTAIPTPTILDNLIAANEIPPDDRNLYRSAAPTAAEY